MNYSQELKQKQAKLVNIKATAVAKKQQVEDLLEKKSRLEKDCQEKFGISLSEVSEKIITLKSEISQLFDQISEGVNQIEERLKTIK